MLARAKRAKRLMASADTETKNSGLTYMAQAILDAKESILAANAKDAEAARETIGDVMLDRLLLNDARISAMAEGILQVSRLPDPCGISMRKTERPNGLVIEKISVPMGVIAIIYESRPNVTSDAAALAIKAGSACVLRAGKEAHGSAKAIARAMKEGLARAGLPEDALFLVEDTTRASSLELMNARGYVDLLIPRGGKGLIRACVDNAKVPVLETGTGICHVYIDKDADMEKALSIIENAKCSRPSVCNAAEVCLVHRDTAERFLPKMKDRLQKVELRLCPEAAKIIAGIPASADDFDTEFLDYILAVKVVGDVREAADHIAAHSTGHSEAIVTENAETARYFAESVDSAAVYVNASTRFTDGGEFGLGCEMGISTQKLHARGPLGLEELCGYKYVITGNGQTR